MYYICEFQWGSSSILKFSITFTDFFAICICFCDGRFSIAITNGWFIASWCLNSFGYFFQAFWEICYTCIWTWGCICSFFICVKQSCFAYTMPACFCLPLNIAQKAPLNSPWSNSCSFFLRVACWMLKNSRTSIIANFCSCFCLFMLWTLFWIFCSKLMGTIRYFLWLLQKVRCDMLIHSVVFICTGLISTNY